MDTLIKIDSPGIRACRGFSFAVNSKPNMLAIDAVLAVED